MAWLCPEGLPDEELAIDRSVADRFFARADLGEHDRAVPAELPPAAVRRGGRA